MRRASLCLLFLCACRQASPPPPPTEIRARTAASLPVSPDDPVWSTILDFPAPLLLQDMVEPRQLERTTPVVHVRSVSDGRRVAFRLQWQDPTRDDEQRPGAFSDACAVQFPARVQADVPAPQMGEAGKDVEIVFWRATWQAALAKGGIALDELYPHASVDHYPFAAARGASAEMAQRYAPARALENERALPRTAPVECLLASGPGTLRPAPGAEAAGDGLRRGDGWMVVLSRPLPAGFEQLGRTQVAFAVWEGAAGEVGARKMRTAWVPFTLEVQP